MNCVSVEPIARQLCLGTCISGQTCRCCSPLQVTMQNVSMLCQRIDNNSTVTVIEEMSYAKIESCSCQECVNNA
jgi:hypothetical protein